MKDAYYFPHDSNAKDDPKCIMLIEQLGLEGYGIYWVLIETLRDQPGYKYPLKLLSALARRFNTTPQKMEVVVKNYDLFSVNDEEFFFSESLIMRMQYFEYKKEMARVAGKKSAEKRRLLLNSGSTDVEQSLDDSSTSKVNNSKENESRVDESIVDDINNNMTPDSLFDLVWKLYPKKEGKGQVSAAQRKKLFRIGYDQLKRCIERYMSVKKGVDRQYLQNGSTFFNSGYVDYLDINFLDGKEPVIVGAINRPPIIKAPEDFNT